MTGRDSSSGRRRRRAAERRAFALLGTLALVTWLAFGAAGNALPF